MLLTCWPYNRNGIRDKTVINDKLKMSLKISTPGVGHHQGSSFSSTDSISTKRNVGVWLSLGEITDVPGPVFCPIKMSTEIIEVIWEGEDDSSGERFVLFVVCDELNAWWWFSALQKFTSVFVWHFYVLSSILPLLNCKLPCHQIEFINLFILSVCRVVVLLMLCIWGAGTIQGKQDGGWWLCKPDKHWWRHDVKKNFPKIRKFGIFLAKNSSKQNNWSSWIIKIEFV